MVETPHWLVQEIPNFLFLAFYIIILTRLKSTSNPHFKSPFYSLFFTTGICGVISVISHMIAAKFIYIKQFEFIQRGSWIANQIGSLGSTIGKLFIVIHRFCVLRSGDIAENVWKPSLLKYIITLQFSIPILCSIPIFFHGYDYVEKDGVIVLHQMSIDGLIMQKTFTNTSYVIYIIVAIVLTALTSRNLARLTSLAQGETKQMIVRQQRNMLIIVLCCTISHFIKAAHQIVWGTASYLRLTEFSDFIWPFYSYANGMATYASPMVLVLLSPTVRSLFYFKRRTMASIGTTSCSPHSQSSMPPSVAPY